MTQEERRRWLIRQLLAEQAQDPHIVIPDGEQAQKNLLRALMNVRPPMPVREAFLTVQDAYLLEELRRKGITDASALPEAEPGICLWQGDITTLRCDAIVNAANSRLLGCFYPCHGCIDNAIHTCAGVQLRLACDERMHEQGYDEPAGRAKLTPGFNLPARYVLHTVGPMVYGRVTARNRAELASCYRSCLTLAAENGLETLAFCCISTGEFRFPNRAAAQIAVAAVRDFLQTPTSIQKVIFNVFKDIDLEIYRQLLGESPADPGRG